MTNRRGLPFARALAVVGLIFWGYYVGNYVLGAPIFLNTDGDNQWAAQIGFGCYGYAVLLIGVVLGALYHEVGAAKEGDTRQIEIRSVIRNAFGSTDFLLGVFASPVVYAVLLQAVDLTNITASGVLGVTPVGLQNGFVCNTIAESMVKSRPST